LLPVEIDATFIANIRNNLPELPRQKLKRFITDMQLSETDAMILTSNRSIADYFEQVSDICKDPRLANNWVRVELMGQLNREGLAIEASPVDPRLLGDLLIRIKDDTISGKIAKTVFDAIWQGEGTADQIIEAKGLRQVSDTSSIEPVIDEIIANNPEQVAQLNAGKEKVLGFFVGQVMKATGGKANPKQVNDLIRQKIM
jgi:aspartyl-tRNA(Asn)/glutamyl-tRNA(Gln) amidotransferase subunit B